MFSIGTFFKSLLGAEKSSFPWKAMWKSKLPPRVAFLLWTVVRGRVLKAENLQTRDFCITEWCFMCMRDGETIDHLFLHCDVANLLWNEIFASQHIDWAMPRRVKGMKKISRQG